MSRSLVITQNITLDGSVEMITDWFDPASDVDADMADLIEQNARLDERCGAMLLGRQTFTDFRGYWPTVDPETDPGDIGPFLDQVAKYVVSTTLGDPEWQNSTVLGSGDPAVEVAALKEQPGPEGKDDIVITGSIRLCHALIAAGLVDEYRFYTYPAVQGGGRRPFPDGHPVPALELVDSQTFRNGLTYAAYRPVATT